MLREGEKAMDLKNIFIQQQDFFNQGYSKSITFREIQLNKLKKTLKQNEDKILTALEADLGKPFMEGYTSELGMLYTSINYAIKNMHKWSKKEKKSTPFYLFFAKAYIKSTPFGNTLILSAFNYPLLLALAPLVGAIAAGNTAMLGLPKSTPTINQVIIEIINTSFGQEYIYAFETDRYLNDEVLSFKFNKIFYTGSSKVGKIVALKAAENLIPITLELGGKSPALVTKNAKINNAADSIVWGKFLNTGQTCVAPDYVLVDKVVSDDLIKAIKNSITKMYGDNLSENTDYGKIVHKKELKRLLDIIDHDQAYLNSEVLSDLDKRYLSPVLISANLAEVKNLKSMEAEIFGPILPVIIYEDLNQAIAYINCNETPLAFYPFSTKDYEIETVLNSVLSGGVTVNDTILHLSNLKLPFGGVNNSGIGNYHGKYSFDTFSHKQAVLKTKSSFKQKLMHPPYSEFKFKLVRFFLK